jgi:hypothetical protein
MFGGPERRYDHHSTKHRWSGGSPEAGGQGGGADLASAGTGGWSTTPGLGGSEKSAVKVVSLTGWARGNQSASPSQRATKSLASASVGNHS